MDLDLDPCAFTPYRETAHRKATQNVPRSYPPPQSEQPTEAKMMLDDNATIQALDTILAETLTSVVDHVIHRSAACRKALIFLLEQVENGADLEWLSAVLQSEGSTWPGPNTDDVYSQSSVDRNASVRSRMSNTSNMTGTTYNDSLSMPGNKWPQRWTSPILEEAPGPDLYHAGYLQTPSKDFPLNGYQDFPTIQAPLQMQTPAIPGFPNLSSPTAALSPYLHLDDASELSHEDGQSRGMYLDVNDHQSYGVNLPGSSACSSTSSSIFPSQSHGQTTPRHGRKHRPKSHRSMKSQSSGNASFKGFVHHKPPATNDNIASRVPCYLCDKTFVISSEFATHVTAEHDQSVQYTCSHRCSHPLNLTWREALLKRHHTTYHPNCSTTQDPSASFSCCVPAPVARHKRIRGCPLCIWVTDNIASWARHQFEKHKGAKRQGISRTLLMKSLLSQDKLSNLWQLEVENLEMSSSYIWDIRWCEDDDAALDDLIVGLETGYWNGEDYFENAAQRQDIVRAAMDATTSTRKPLRPATMEEVPVSKRPPSSSPTGSRCPKSLREHFHIRSPRSKSNLTSNNADAPTTTPRGQSSAAGSVNFSKKQIIPVRGGKTRPSTPNNPNPSFYGVFHSDQVHPFS